MHSKERAVDVLLALLDPDPSLSEQQRFFMMESAADEKHYINNKATKNELETLQNIIEGTKEIQQKRNILNHMKTCTRKSQVFDILFTVLVVSHDIGQNRQKRMQRLISYGGAKYDGSASYESKNNENSKFWGEGPIPSC